jgi:hypothetical protein
MDTESNSTVTPFIVCCPDVQAIENTANLQDSALNLHQTRAAQLKHSLVSFRNPPLHFVFVVARSSAHHPMPAGGGLRARATGNRARVTTFAKRKPLLIAHPLVLSAARRKARTKFSPGLPPRLTPSA